VKNLRTGVVEKSPQTRSARKQSSLCVRACVQRRSRHVITEKTVRVEWFLIWEYRAPFGCPNPPKPATPVVLPGLSVGDCTCTELTAGIG